MRATINGLASRRNCPLSLSRPQRCPTPTSAAAAPAAAVEPPISSFAARARTTSRTSICPLPVGKLIIVTGVSGSGKSSLAFDTIYAEGQRRYVESLSAYARQFLERMEKPDVDRIDGISPAIAIRQKNSIRNPRSTVGTTTEIHDYMRLLFARVGRTFCRNCGREVVRETAEVVARQLGELPRGHAAAARLRSAGRRRDVGSTAPRTSARTADDGASRQADDGDGPTAARIRRLEPASSGPTTGGGRPSRRRSRRCAGRASAAARSTAAPCRSTTSIRRRWRDRPTLQVVVDRVQLGAQSDLRQRLTDSIETAYLEGGGAAWAVAVAAQPRAPSRQSRILFSERFECRPCGIAYEDPQPRLFSFNNPFGACPTCHGFGNIIELDMDLVVPDPTKSIQQGAIEPWSKPHYRAQLAELKRAAQEARRSASTCRGPS